jgi:transposase
MIAYIGVDVGEEHLDAWDESQRVLRRFRNTPEGVIQLCYWLERSHPGGTFQVVLEPTSVYHHHLVLALHQWGVAYTVINPRRTASFAQGEGSRAKTDKADARALGRMGAEKQLPPTLHLDAEREELKYLRRQVEWLQEQLQAARNRRDTMKRSPFVPDPVVANLDGVMRDLEQGVQDMEEEIKGWLKQHPHLQAEVRLVDTVKGIAWRTAVLIVSEFPAVQHCKDAKDWVAYAGLNPEVRQSGKSWAAALSRMGPAGIRKGLYWPAIVALRANPSIKSLGERLQAKGKLSKQIIVAGMAKLVRQSFAVLKSGKPFDPQWHLQGSIQQPHPTLDMQYGI